MAPSHRRRAWRRCCRFCCQASRLSSTICISSLGSSRAKWSPAQYCFVSPGRAKGLDEARGDPPQDEVLQGPAQHQATGGRDSRDRPGGKKPSSPLAAQGSRCCTRKLRASMTRARQVQEVTGQAVEVAFVEQGYSGEGPARDVAAQGIRLEAVKLPQAKKGFVLLPRRGRFERSIAWVARFRRLARDYERLPETLAGLHFLAFATVLLRRFVLLITQSA